MADFLARQISLTPLDLLSQSLLMTGLPDVVNDIMDSYDAFLSLLDDPERRTHLETLRFEDVGDDPIFEHVRHLSHSFQRGLTGLFFGDERFRELTIDYGVF